MFIVLKFLGGFFMKLFKKICNLILPITILLTTTACGKVDKSWALKLDKITITNGMYVFYLKEAYNKALDRLSDDNITTESLEAANIDDQKAADWIKSEAIKSCKEYIVIEKLFDDNKLSFSDDELSEMDKDTESVWESSSEDYERLGISREDLHKALTLFNRKNKKLFEHLYSAEKFREISNDEILEYYKQNYVSLSRFSKVVSEDDDSSQTTDSSESKSQADSQFKQYVDSINNGSKTVEQVASEFKSTENLEEDPLSAETLNLKDGNLDKDFEKLIKDLPTGKATYTNYTDIFILIFKNDINTHLPDLNNESEKNDIVESIKLDEFTLLIDSKKDELKIQINENSLKDFDPISTFK